MGFLHKFFKNALSGHHQNQGDSSGAGHHGASRHGLPVMAPAPAPGSTGAVRGCTSCQVVQAADARFCMQCGQPMLSNCSQCSSPLSAGARFCNQCGKPAV